MQAFGRKVTATAGSLIGTEGVSQHYQHALGELVNHRYTLPGGDQLHVALDARPIGDGGPIDDWALVGVDAGTRVSAGHWGAGAEPRELARAVLARFGVAERRLDPRVLLGDRPPADVEGPLLSASDLTHLDRTSLSQPRHEQPHGPRPESRGVLRPNVRLLYHKSASI